VGASRTLNHRPWGLGVVEGEDEDELRAFAARDPVVISGTAEREIGRMLAGFVRPLIRG
jgi:hypothetical protein